MASAFGVPGTVRESVGVLYRRAVEEELLPGSSIEGMATVSLSAATRQHGTPRPLSKFADVSRSNVFATPNKERNSSSGARIL